MLKFYNPIKNYFSKKEKRSYQLQNPEWFDEAMLEKFRTKPEPKDTLISYFEWAESFVK